MSRFILFLFILSLSTPTIVRLIEKDFDISIFYDCSEEENSKDLKDLKELKATLKIGFEYSFIPNGNSKSIIVIENESRHNNLFDDIFIPPPELV